MSESIGVVLIVAGGVLGFIVVMFLLGSLVGKLIRSRSHITDYYDTPDHRLDSKHNPGHGMGGGGGGL